MASDKRQPALLNTTSAFARLLEDVRQSARVLRHHDADFTASRIDSFADILSRASSGDPEAQREVAAMLGMEPTFFGQSAHGVTAYRWPALPSEPKEPS